MTGYSQNSIPSHDAVRGELLRRGLVPASDDFSPTRFDPARYIRERLGWEPWEGTAEHPGQVEVLEAYTLALRQQEERKEYEAGTLRYEGGKAVRTAPDGRVTRSEAYWTPGQVIKNRIRIEAGHTVGKTKLASGLVNHFFDHCAPAIIYTYAPGWEQIHDLLWKEVKADRRGKGLPGRILDLELKVDDDHFAKGKATNNAGGTGSERAHGQHGPYLMFVLDEAEGVADFVWDAVDSMASGGVVIVLMLANPRTRTSRFHTAKNESAVVNFRMSCVYHPNVLADRELIPGAVRRDYVESMLEKHAKEVDGHDPDLHTFELPWRPGVVYRPNPVFMWRVMGQAPANSADKNLITTGRYETAVNREVKSDRPERAWMGVDCARFGNDFGTLYIRHDGAVWRAAEFAQEDTEGYFQKIKSEALALARLGVKDLRIRVDGGGGFGGGIVDRLRNCKELREAFETFHVYEVHFNAVPYDREAYADLITEMTATAGEALNALSLVGPPESLQSDLCAREYRWTVWNEKDVKELESKDKFRKRLGRSPDDGDGFVLAAAPDHLFATKPARTMSW